MPIMPELIEAGLFGRGLIKVDDSILVHRYNACLEDMGLLPTSLPSFQIDKMGWSPEIAVEQDNDYYLSHGEANPLAIVLTPEQLNPKTPIYFPFHSFDWDLMTQWGAANRKEIFELTKETAVWLDIDQEVDLYPSPSELLSVYEVIVRAHTPDGLMSRAIEQHDLVGEFLREEDSYLDMELIEKIRTSRETAGDLRTRSLVIRDFVFSDLRNFYSRAFGGVFVLRTRNDTELIFAQDAKVARRFGVEVAGQNALQPLVKNGYVETDVGWWKNNLYRLHIIAESFLMEVLDKEEPDLDFVSLNSAEQKSVIQRYGDKLGMHLELRRLCRKLENGQEKVQVSAEAATLLIHPAHDLTPVTHEVIGQLLTFIHGGRLVPLFYRHQKTDFAKAYARVWKTPRRSWARRRIREHYDLASKSSTTPS